MNKGIVVLALLCGFLLGVIAGPWLWPRGLIQAPLEEESATETVALLPEPPPPPPAPPEATPPEPELVLKGVFVGGEASRALIASGADAPRPYKTDDKLPDGSVLKAINIKDVEVEKNGEIRTLPLERGMPTAETEEIEEAPGVVEEPAAAEEATEETGGNQPETPTPAAGETTATP